MFMIYCAVLLGVKALEENEKDERRSGESGRFEGRLQRETTMEEGLLRSV